MKRTVLEDDIWEIIDTLLPEGCELIWALQSDPRPKRPYVTLNLTTPAIRVGHDEQRIQGSDIRREGVRRFVLSLNAYGKEAFDILDGILSGLYLESTLQLLQEKGLACQDEGPIQNLSALQDTSYETRAQMDLTFGRSTDTDEGLGVIEKVEVNDELVELTG